MFHDRTTRLWFNAGRRWNLEDYKVCTKLKAQIESVKSRT